MKFEREKLLAGLEKIRPAIGKGDNVPILTHVRFADMGEAAELTASDLEVAVQTCVECGGDVFDVCIPFSSLYEITKLSPGDVEIEKDGERVVVSSGKSVWKLAVLPGEEFPNLPEIPDDSFYLQTGFLSEAISRVAFAVCKEESRYALNGVLFQGVGGDFKMVATDGRCLSMLSELGLISSEVPDFEVIVPMKALNIARKMDDVHVAPAANEIYFSDKTSVVMGRLIKGEFVDYERIIPDVGRTFDVRFDVKDFRDVVQRVGVLASESSSMVLLKIGGGRITVSMLV